MGKTQVLRLGSGGREGTRALGQDAERGVLFYDFATLDDARHVVSEFIQCRRRRLLARATRPSDPGEVRRALRKRLPD